MVEDKARLVGFVSLKQIVRSSKEYQVGAEMCKTFSVVKHLNLRPSKSKHLQIEKRKIELRAGKK